MNLEQRVYKKLLDVPKGQITTYGELAKAVGLKNGQRVIGKIMNNNPYPVIVPCHRVVMPGITPMPSAANFLLIRADQSLVPLRE